MEENRISVECYLNRTINFAMQQNYVPVIRSITVKNESEEKLTNVKLIITFEPEFAKEFSYNITEIEVGEKVEISPVRINLCTQFLFSLTEKMIGNIMIDVNIDGENKHIFDGEIELLAYDQWSGSLIMPEIIAAFVTPNHPLVTEIIKSAALNLQKWSETLSFSGYQTRNPNNVKFQMAAIYSAIQSIGIIYNNPPASYEAIGQRVRLPHAVIEQKMGTCLDLTILYVACLEAVGLYPLIIINMGHAYAGCWLEEETFADCVIDDISTLEKRTVDGASEILLVECTDFTSNKSVDFDKAIKHGRDHLQNIDDFVYMIDICRTRGSGIRPIPVKLEQSYTSSDNSLESKEQEVAAPKEMDMSLLGRIADDNSPVTKQKLWERKLLDFSLRNTLLSFRATKNAIQIMTANLGELEDKLSDGSDFRVMEVPSEWTVSLRDVKIYEIENEKDLIQNIATTEFASKRIRTFLTTDELESSLKSLQRAAKLSIEENGTNTLYLALGFLRWFESDVSEKPRYAPIVLIPIELVRNTRAKGYIIRSRQEDAQVNITLLEYLRQDYGINITGLDPLPADEHGIDLPLIFNTVRQAVMGKKRWNIVDMAFMGLFSFGQFVMWNDIRNRSKELEENKVVKSLIEGKMTWEPVADIVTADRLDAELSPSDMAIPVSADSSQMVAISAAAKGQSFVLHGPPGTGKSQTITNMIANALYQGKSVLFVAEKMAALNVVQKRLANIGLDPFCLELHSNKTNKSAVLGQLNTALEVGLIKSPDEYEATADKLNELRKELNYVVEAIHCKREYGLSLYQAVERYEQNKQYRSVVSFDKNQISSISEDKIKLWDDVVRKFGVAINEIGKYTDSPFKGYEGTEYSLEIRESLEKSLNEIKGIYYEVDEAVKELNSWAGIDTDNNSESGSYEEIVRRLNLAISAENSAPTLKKMILTERYDDVKFRINELVQTGSDYSKLNSEIISDYEPQIVEFNVNEAALEWKKTENTWFIPKIIGQNRLVKEMKLYSKDASSVSKDNIKDKYTKLQTYAAMKKQIAETPIEITDYLDGMYMGTESNWKMVIDAVDKADKIRELLNNVDEERRTMYVNTISESSKLTDKVKKSMSAISSFITKIDELKAKYCINMDIQEKGNNWLNDVKAVIDGYSSNIADIKAWIVYNQKDNLMRQCCLECIADAYRNNDINYENLDGVYTCNLYFALLINTIASDNRLADFQGKQFEEIVKKYSETIDELSPISVAQYIDPAFPKFDLVIFDEASQLPTSEAVGTIARGENVIVVGDPKQLPPTSFFKSNRFDEDNSEKEDLESLLDDCLAISMPQEHLKWHYRSRHESLIAYSNMKYYDNKLYTFPSPNDLLSEVKMVHVDGFYDKGKTKHNKAEAQAVVNEIIRRLKDEKLRNDSIGVVTFSSVQQNLIDDMLTEEFTKNPDLEDFDRQSKEPVFIKNLENVQGDERDVILFSIGYGPDKDGKVSMNFGPLNRDGGWRRLNVAISRARKQMIVYSVIRPEQIDISRTRSEGVAGLRGFLEFAERGTNVIAGAANSQKRSDKIVNEVAKAVKELGYTVNTNIGCSEYKMDIGIVNPNNQDTYALGILLDGQNCKDAATAKDRFVLQPGVLKGLGWKIMRLWVLEWLDNPERVKNMIKDEIEKSLVATEVSVEVSKQEMVFEKVDEADIVKSVAVKYEAALSTIAGVPEDFYSDHSADKIIETAKDILAIEAPISRKLLLKKVLLSYGINRSGSKVEGVFAKTIATIEKKITIDGENAFLWRIDQEPEEYAGFRTEDQFGNKRSMDDIPSSEILNAIYEVLGEQIALSRTDLIRETAKKFGYVRLGNVIETTVSLAINKGIECSRLTDNADKITIVE